MENNIEQMSSEKEAWWQKYEPLIVELIGVEPSRLIAETLNKLAIKLSGEINNLTHQLGLKSPSHLYEFSVQEKLAFYSELKSGKVQSGWEENHQPGLEKFWQWDKSEDLIQKHKVI